MSCLQNKAHLVQSERNAQHNAGANTALHRGSDREVLNKALCVLARLHMTAHDAIVQHPASHSGEKHQKSAFPAKCSFTFPTILTPFCGKHPRSRACAIPRSGLLIANRRPDSPGMGDADSRGTAWSLLVMSGKASSPARQGPSAAPALAVEISLTSVSFPRAGA